MIPFLFAIEPINTLIIYIFCKNRLHTENIIILDDMCDALI